MAGSQVQAQSSAAPSGPQPGDPGFYYQNSWFPNTGSLPSGATNGQGGLSSGVTLGINGPPQGYTGTGMGGSSQGSSGSGIPAQGSSQYQNYWGTGQPYLPSGYDPNSAPAQMYLSWQQAQHSMAGNPNSSWSAPQLPQLKQLPASQTPAANPNVTPDSTGMFNSNDNNNSMYLNPYWTQIQQQGHTSRELGTGENLTQVRNNEAGVYGINPNQVNVVNSGGKTYLQVPWQLAQNRALTQSATEQAQQNAMSQSYLAQNQPQPQQQPSIQDFINQAINPNALNQQAQQQYQTQVNSINQIIAQDQQMQKAEDNLLQQQLKDAVGQQNNTSFQDWLKAREGLAARGLGNSGFLADAMVRNQLNNQDKMQSIYDTAMDNQAKADATYQGDIARQQAQIDNLSPTSIFQGMYNDAFKNAMSMAPYYMPTAAEQMTNQLGQQKLNESELNQLGLGTNPFTGQVGQTLTAQNDQNTWLTDAYKLALQQAGVTGMYNGSPTLSALQSGGWTIGPDGKLVQTETAANNSADLQYKYDALNWQKQYQQQMVNISAGNLNERTAMDNNTVAHWAQQTSDTQTSQQMSQDSTLMTQAANQMKNLLTADPKASDPNSGSPNSQAYQYWAGLYAQYYGDATAIHNSPGK